ncbi:MAG: hypothetical protein K6E29_00620 [Cyanobacteria bacterium RUI128]|nr:hypothetical protein [Cyanobacteria bacterium RUI128]
MKKFLIIFLIIMCTTLGCYAKKTADSASVNVLEQKGYTGTLPDILDKFQTTKPEKGTPIFEAEEGFDDPDKLKPIPRDNPAFVDIILKKDKTSTYVNDINRIIPQVEALMDCIENQEDVQRFVAKATTLSFSIGALRKRYDGKPESYYISYTKLMTLAIRAKSIAELRREGAEYNKYLAYQSAGAIYAPDNINKELQYFLEELQDVLKVLREVE